MATDHLDTQVIVVGAGPVGLMLAGELRLAGAEVIVLEQLAAPTTESRASTMHARTMEILDSRGLLPVFGALPNEPRGHFGGIPLDLTLPSEHPGQWKVPQTRTEQVLGGWAVGLGADLRRGARVVDLTDDGDAVTVTFTTPSGPGTLRAAYVVGCDGERSTVRELTGIPFPGRPMRRELLRADVAGIEIRNRRFERLDRGLAIAARNPAGITRVMVHEFGSTARERSAEPEFGELTEVWQRVTGEDISHGIPVWVNSFGDANRQLSAYRHGRVLFAGDAAHVQMPIGGQALNLGLQDAVNLGWKLAAVVCGRSGADLLDTYHAERHAVGARVLANISTQALLLLGDAEIEPARDLLAELIGTEANRTRLAGTISGLDTRYPVGSGDHPLLGARLPAGNTLPRNGTGLLIDRADGSFAAAAAPWAGRVTAVRTESQPGDPLDGADAALVRPDGHIAWLGTAPAELPAALRRWFGPPVIDTAEEKLVDTDVIVVGAGPTGLMLAGELRLGGARVTVVERRAQPTGQSRGLGFTARAMEVFDQRGLLPKFGDIKKSPMGHFAGVQFNYAVLAECHFGARGIPQNQTESVLENWATELGADIRRGWELETMTDDGECVTITAQTPDGPETLRARYLVGCDGGRSAVRRLGGFDFPGTSATRSMYLADVVGCELRPRFLGERLPNGMVMAAPLEPGVDRIILCPHGTPAERTEPPTYQELADTWQRVTGEDISHGSAKWVSMFTDATRQVTEYRRGRVLVCGDAAHIHLPAGGQGLSCGVQDAANLGWKLAAVIAGWAPDGLLDTYHSERHPAGARLLMNTRAQGMVFLGGEEA
ncbi:MAG TPA: FAD-dependent monooxygenase, partial [Micromonosporaceae bacterium]|nr:FAD-dependent monooxygenase [Micromonosporaceae bacterium]